MQPSTSECASTSISVSPGSKQVKHDKQESDISMYRGVQSQNTKEESSDESTIISSQTSTLTRNQGCDELQTAVSLRLEELANCLRSPEEEDECRDSDSGSDDSDEEGIIVEFIEDNVLEDVLEHEVYTKCLTSTNYLDILVERKNIPYSRASRTVRLFLYLVISCFMLRLSFRRKMKNKPMKLIKLRIRKPIPSASSSQNKESRGSFPLLELYLVQFLMIKTPSSSKEVKLFHLAQQSAEIITSAG